MVGGGDRVATAENSYLAASRPFEALSLAHSGHRAVASASRPLDSYRPALIIAPAHTSLAIPLGLEAGMAQGGLAPGRRPAEGAA